MYTKPFVARVDPTAEVASCCRIIVSTDSSSTQIVNEPLCPFPGPSVCVAVYEGPYYTTSLGDVVVCVLAT